MSEAVKFTARQERFIQAMAIGNRQTDSARLAGYEFPAQAAYVLMSHGGIRAAIRRRQERDMVDLVPLARRALLEVARDADVDTQLRITAAHRLLEHADRVGWQAGARRAADAAASAIAAIPASQRAAFRDRYSRNSCNSNSNGSS